MKQKYWLVLGVAAIGATQAAACSSNFDSCKDSRTCASAGAGDAGTPTGDSAGEAGAKAVGGGTDAEGGEGGTSGAGAGAGPVDHAPVLFGDCSMLGVVACQGTASAQRLACDGAKWQAGTTCADGELCDSSTGKCAKEIAECVTATPGQVVCREDTPVTCGPDLVSTVDGQACAGLCKDGACQAPVCGDKKLEPGEDCDDGDTTGTGACVKCKTATCGDGAVYAGHEECDDANTVAGDGCSATCNDEPVALALGGATSCALSAKGVLKCWGDNQHGALGAGDTVVRGDGPGQMGKYLLPVQLGMNRTVKGISAAEWANCAVLDNGQVKCWGQNAGQLGTSGVSDVGDGPAEMGDALGSVDLGTGRSAKSVSLAATHACAVLDNASLKCWGVGEYGVLGQGEAIDRPSPASLMPVNVGAGRTVQTVSASNRQSCALLDNGSGKCWGLGYFGSLSVDLSAVDLDASGSVGDSSGEMALLPGLSFGSQHTAKSMVGGSNATCAILDDNSVRCWGKDYYGEVGQESVGVIGNTPTALSALPAVNLGTARTAKMLSFGYSHVCAVLDNGSVKCWGGNESGQLGVGNASDQGNDPGEMGDALKAVPLGPGRTAHFIATGQSHSCAILDNGTVVCWGLNDKGQLGLGNVTNVGDAGGLAGVSLTAVDLSF